MSFTKKGLTVLTILLFLTIIIVTPLLFSKHNDIPKRTIEGIATELTPEEKVEKFKEKFDDINTNSNGNISTFSAKISYSKIDLMSTDYEGAEDVVSDYGGEINYQEETFKITCTTIVNDCTVATEEEEFVTEYVEDPEAFYLVDKQGNKIDIVGEIETSEIDECLAITITAGISALIAALAALIAIPPIIEALPEITDAVKQLTEGIVDGATKFWDSLKLTLGGITAIELPNSIYFTQAKAEDIYKEAQKRKHCYLLCAIVDSDKPIAIKYKFTDVRNAANWIKKGGSVWSPFGKSARKAIKTAGYLAGDSKGIVNNYEQTVSSYDVPTFKHYHALNVIYKKKVGDMHSFFGLPSIKEMP